MSHPAAISFSIGAMQQTRCPECNANFDAGAVFDTLRPQTWCQGMSDEQLRQYVSEHYGDENARFSRLIGVEVQGLYDGVIKWRCPDCSAEWPRFRKVHA